MSLWLNDNCAVEVVACGCMKWGSVWLKEAGRLWLNGWNMGDSNGRGKSVVE